MTKSLRRHYKSCGKCHGNERPKRKAFRRLRKNRHRRSCVMELSINGLQYLYLLPFSRKRCISYDLHVCLSVSHTMVSYQTT